MKAEAPEPSPFAGETAVAVCPVGDASRPPRRRNLADAAEWYAAVSGGRWRPVPVDLPAVTLDHSLGRYRMSRGIGAQGHTTQNLVAAVIAGLDVSARELLRSAGGRIVLVVPLDLHPHVWHPRNGGIALGAQVWCRRYAMVPAAAPLGTVAHELGHLLLGWRDGDTSEGCGGDCLMATGGLRGGGEDPAPPCAPLLLAAGWRRAIALDRGLTVARLAAAPDLVGVLTWRERRVVTELRDDRLLVYAGDTHRPKLVVEMLIQGQSEQPVLGLLAPTLRRRVLSWPKISSTGNSATGNSATGNSARLGEPCHDL